VGAGAVENCAEEKRLRWSSRPLSVAGANRAESGKLLRVNQPNKELTYEHSGWQFACLCAATHTGLARLDVLIDLRQR